MTLDRFIFLILVFLHKLRSSTIKGHFHSTLVSNIILCTSLSSNRTIFFGFFRFLLDFSLEEPFQILPLKALPGRFTSVHWYHPSCFLGILYTRTSPKTSRKFTQSFISHFVQKGENTFNILTQEIHCAIIILLGCKKALFLYIGKKRKEEFCAEDQE